ncbi:TRAP transporter small permease [Afifella sp. YEN Y35]|uniref:TRAP transporter small permease n=1 Tax=Afifella sp. YEN Y35 TaxID=3388337 RepID=UPI0039E00C5D
MAIGTFYRIFQTVMKALLVLLIGVLLAVMTLQIIMRYSFSASLIWAEEVCRYLLIWVSLIAGIFAYEKGEIAAMTLLRDALPRRIGLGLAIFCNLAAAILCLALVYYGWRYAEMVGSQPIPALRFLFEDTFGWPQSYVPTVFWVYFSLPLGMAFMAVRLLVDIVHYIRLMASGGSVGDLRPIGPEGVAE